MMRSAWNCVKRNRISARQRDRGDILREQLESVEERGYDSGRKVMCRQVFSLQWKTYFFTLRARVGKLLKLPLVLRRLFWPSQIWDWAHRTESQLQSIGGITGAQLWLWLVVSKSCAHWLWMRLNSILMKFNSQMSAFSAKYQIAAIRARSRHSRRDLPFKKKKQLLAVFDE